MPLIRIIDAGYREIDFAQRLVREGKLPQGITAEDVLAHGVYDPVTDEIIVTVKAVVRRWKVEAP